MEAKGIYIYTYVGVKLLLIMIFARGLESIWTVSLYNHNYFIYSSSLVSFDRTAGKTTNLDEQWNSLSNQ